MLRLTIDGVEVQVAEGTNLVEASKKAGIEIPTTCYHPGLRVVGQCRICFVEVESMPHLVTACSTPAQNGMIVMTKSPRVRNARAAVLEFLLANHPLDCPVCDQAGECSLQDFSMEIGLDESRMIDEKRTFPGFESRQIGPAVVQNQNRCIRCSRCIRFTQEIFETHDLIMKGRGARAYIDTFDGRPFDNPWSACVADVCPVGALTVKDFRFRARVWHLMETPSICPGCSVGCNIDVGHLDGVVHRFKPRTNPEINGWWMCDHGRSLASDLNNRDLDRPAVRSGSTFSTLTWNEALVILAETIVTKKPRIVASANLSNEALFLIRRLFVEHLDLEVVVPTDSGAQRWIKNERGTRIESIEVQPNGTGARLIGLSMVDEKGLRDFVSQSSVILLDNRAHAWLAGPDAAAELRGRLAAVFGRRHTELSRTADLIFPTASWFETEGSFTSSTGRVQLARPGWSPVRLGRPAWRTLTDLAVRLDLPLENCISPRRVFEEIVQEIPAFAGMTYRRLSSEPGIPILKDIPHVG
ncbi:MAG: (2Fe-2S)-binding protein [Thermoanaerobaculales bacterium]|nr:(2Fe-2S)-binding protein [Thermoanaerobaculales bacterium]